MASQDKDNSEEKKVKLIRKSNDLVEGRYRFDIWEMRVFTKMLMMIHKDDADFKEYRIYLKDLVKEFDIKDKNAYEWIKKGSEGLMKKEISIERETPDGIMEFKTYIAVGVDSFKATNGKFVDISFHPKMKPLLLQLQTQFLMYDVQNVLGLQSGFSVRIYELLKQYERIGKRKFKIKELKEILDISKKYPLYGNFKQRIIQKAKEDLESYTDIRFEFEEIKYGKSVEEIVFYIFKNDGLKTLKIAIPEVDSVGENKSESFEEVWAMVKNWQNANKSTIRDWLLKYDVGFIKYRINLVNNLLAIEKKIKNPIGYVQKLLLQPDLFDSIQDEKDKKIEQQEKARREAIDKQRKEQQLSNQKLTFEEAKRSLINEVFDTYPHLAKQFIDNLRVMRSLVNPPFIVELAYDHYVTKIEGIGEGTKEEILYNYELGGSFAAYLLDWLETNFKEQFLKIKAFEVREMV
ncbi:replication initiation protein [Emticicia oligotrophica]|uniref:replication initiation protein n=1 Tax=Emticicia oligotrophica TaxID=312279 RepID=UPI00273A81C4|nr:replication initiation protein [Emticicia oligotrophica]